MLHLSNQTQTNPQIHYAYVHLHYLYWFYPPQPLFIYGACAVLGGVRLIMGFHILTG